MKTRSILLYLISLDLLILIFTLASNTEAKKYYKEFQLATWVSFFKLVSISYISYRIYMLRSKYLKNHYSSRFWLLVSMGFLFLAFDDLFLIHENIDKLIHFLLNIKETNLTDRIDDIIVLIYGIVGISVLYHYRSEVLRFRKTLLLLSGGFAFLFLRILIDIITNRNDILPLFIEETTLLLTVTDTLAVFEGMAKLVAESFFIAAFYNSYISFSKQGTS